MAPKLSPAGGPRISELEAQVAKLQDLSHAAKQAACLKDTGQRTVVPSLTAYIESMLQDLRTDGHSPAVALRAVPMAHVAGAAPASLSRAPSTLLMDLKALDAAKYGPPVAPQVSTHPPGPAVKRSPSVRQLSTVTPTRSPSEKVRVVRSRSPVQNSGPVSLGTASSSKIRKERFSTPVSSNSRRPSSSARSAALLRQSPAKAQQRLTDKDSIVADKGGKKGEANRRPSPKEAWNYKQGEEHIRQAVVDEMNVEVAIGLAMAARGAGSRTESPQPGILQRHNSLDGRFTHRQPITDAYHTGRRSSTDRPPLTRSTSVRCSPRAMIAPSVSYSPPLATSSSFSYATPRMMNGPISGTMSPSIPRIGSFNGVSGCNNAATVLLPVSDGFAATLASTTAGGSFQMPVASMPRSGSMSVPPPLLRSSSPSARASFPLSGSISVAPPLLSGSLSVPGSTRASFPVSGSLNVPASARSSIPVALPVPGSMNVPVTQSLHTVREPPMRMTSGSFIQRASSPLLMPTTSFTPLQMNSSFTPLMWSASGQHLSSAAAAPAFKYKSDKSDMMDMAMSWTLCKLDAVASSVLCLRRLMPGRYEVDGRRVSVIWRNPKHTDLLAREDDVPGSEPVPLLDYLRQAASVALSLGARKVVASPIVQGRPTFLEFDQTPQETSDVNASRVRSMLLACREAGVKEARVGQVSL